MHRGSYKTAYPQFLSLDDEMPFWASRCIVGVVSVICAWKSEQSTITYRPKYAGRRRKVSLMYRWRVVRIVGVLF